MKIYNYNRLTAESVSESNAAESPLEPGVFLMPANSTQIAPPVAAAKKVAVFENGDWVVKDDFRNETWYAADRTPVIIAEIGTPVDLVSVEPAKTQSELNEEFNRTVKEQLTQVDFNSIRALREWLMTQADTPQSIIDYEAEAVALRTTLK